MLRERGFEFMEEVVGVHGKWGWSTWERGVGVHGEGGGVGVRGNNIAIAVKKTQIDLCCYFVHKITPTFLVQTVTLLSLLVYCAI